MLTERRSRLLNFIVEDYVSTATPVGSQYVVRKHRVPYSPATVRLEMARLEDDGYISQPHTSAGRIPSDKGYRYYVEALMEEEALPQEELQTIQHQFHQATRAVEEWFQLAAAVLARSAGNFAVVTAPHSRETRLRHVQLVSLQDFVALCLVVFEQARLRQQVLTLPRATTQEELAAVALRVNALVAGHSATEFARLPQPAGEIDDLVVGVVRDLTEQEDVAIGDVFRDGVREVLSQPEFVRSGRMLDLIDVLEPRSLIDAIALRQLSDEGINVVIGSENVMEAMRECSVVVGRYGVTGGPSGVIAVLGPTRMHYARTIPVVRYLSTLLADLVAQI